jgi:hypothetical protein
MKYRLELGAYLYGVLSELYSAEDLRRLGALGGSKSREAGNVVPHRLHIGNKPPLQPGGISGAMKRFSSPPTERLPLVDKSEDRFSRSTSA